jgi:hypothetical protein
MSSAIITFIAEDLSVSCRWPWQQKQVLPFVLPPAQYALALHGGSLDLLETHIQLLSTERLRLCAQGVYDL